MAVIEVPVRRDAADMQMASDAFFWGRQHQGKAGACVCFITNDKGRRVAGPSGEQSGHKSCCLHMKQQQQWRVQRVRSDLCLTDHMPGHSASSR